MRESILWLLGICVTLVVARVTLPLSGYEVVGQFFLAGALLCAGAAIALICVVAFRKKPIESAVPPSTNAATAGNDSPAMAQTSGTQTHYGHGNTFNAPAQPASRVADGIYQLGERIGVVIGSSRPYPETLVIQSMRLSAGVDPASAVEFQDLILECPQEFKDMPRVNRLTQFTGIFDQPVTFKVIGRRT